MRDVDPSRVQGSFLFVIGFVVWGTTRRMQAVVAREWSESPFGQWGSVGQSIPKEGTNVGSK